MGGMSKKFDPANIFGKRPGGIDYRGAIDPGGAAIKGWTGSDIGYKVADPGKLYQPPDQILPTSQPKSLTAFQKRKKRVAQQYKKKFGGSAPLLVTEGDTSLNF